jgi:hypothetical protein
MDLIREEVTLVSLGGDSHIKFNFQEKKELQFNFHCGFDKCRSKTTSLNGRYGTKCLVDVTKPWVTSMKC